MRARVSKPTPLLFYSFSAEQIAAWCGVSRRTALAYKRGLRRPSPQAVRLFVLHRDGRVLPDSWGRGWALTETSVVDPERHELPITWIRGYFLLMQWARSQARDLGVLRDFERLRDQIGVQR